MIRNYFKTAWRNLWRSKVTSAISIAGLSIGVGCFLLLTTYILNELRYDRFHTNASRINRLAFHYKSSDDVKSTDVAVTPTAAVPVFKDQIAGVEDGVRIVSFSDKGAAVQYQDKLINEKKVLLADDSFFKIFSFKFIAGNQASVLNNPGSIVVTASTAKKYFGEDNPIGKILKLNNKYDMLVTGVIEDIPAYSQIKFDMMGTYSILARSKTRQWDSANDYAYLLLKKDTNVKDVEQHINAYVNNLFKTEISNGSQSWYTLEPLTKVHLYSSIGSGLEPSGNIKYVYILGIIAVILLLLACINFLNLVTAKSAERAHEIGVRKVMGALRKQLFLQFISEAAILTLISLSIGVLLTYISFGWFSTLSNQQLGFQIWNFSWIIAALVIVWIGITLLAGAYPALYLSGFNPVVSLKSKSTGRQNGALLRKSLVVFQFVVSVFFIVSTLIAGQQLKYIQTLNTGINRSQVMVINTGGMPYEKLAAFKDELKQREGVQYVSASYDSPINIRGGYTINKAEGKSGNFKFSVTAIPVERNFLNTLGIKILQGDNFTLADEQQVLDTAYEKRHYSFIINETACRNLNWTPQQAIGKHINLNGREGEIKAIAKDFNFASLHQAITPVVIFPEYDWLGKVLVKVSSDNINATVNQVKSTWKSFYPNNPFDYQFLDEEFNNMYRTDERTSQILNVFSAVTIFISCLGLLGLAVFTTQQRTKEVGVRKVLGAGVLNIVALISADFLKLVLIAIVIASPIAWYVMHEWLQDFSYRIIVQWYLFVLAGGIAVLIAFVTVSFQSIKAALINPIKSLRSE